MAFFIVGIIFIIAALAAMGFAKGAKDDNEYKFIASVFGIGGLVLGCILFGFSVVRVVPTGNTGVVTVFGKVEDFTLESGIHLAAPWQGVVCMDNRTQKQQIQMSCFSSDIQEVTVTYTVNFQINKASAQTIYKTIGTDYFNIVVLPKTLEAVKAVIAQYNAESLVASRGVLSAQIEDALSGKLAASNIELVATSLENLDFTDAFTNAVEAKQVAEQNKLRAQTEQEQQIIEAEAQAKKQVIAAEAKAKSELIAAQNDVEVQKLAADASEYAGQKQASINQRIADSLTPELVNYYMIEAWGNGADMPQVILGNGGIFPTIDLTGTLNGKGE